MRRIINSTYISLDGVVEQPHEWPTIERPSDERGQQIQTSLLMACDWANTRVISGDVAGQIRELKAQPGQDIVKYGFGAVLKLLMEHGLLDELRLWFHPLFVGKGTSDDLLFPKGPTTQFELTDSTILKHGTAILTYRLA
jgi:dihydrofolate reductase